MEGTRNVKQTLQSRLPKRQTPVVRKALRCCPTRLRRGGQDVWVARWVAPKLLRASGAIVVLAAVATATGLRPRKRKPVGSIRVCHK